MSTGRKRHDPVTDWPGYWFLLLEKYLNDGDILSAAEAVRQLGRLGFEVKYRMPRERHPEGGES